MDSLRAIRRLVTLGVITVTLGLFPTVAKEREGLEVTLATLDSRATVGVAPEHDGRSMIGWAGGLSVAIAPGWMAPSTHERRMYAQLALDIARKADAIRALTRR